MTGHFPLFPLPSSLSRRDFDFLCQPFTEAIKEKIVAAPAAHISFIHTKGEIEPLSSRHDTQNTPILQQVCAATQRAQTPATHEDCLLLPFFVSDTHTAVALIQGIDPFLVKKMSPDWLQEIRDTLQHEFLRIKWARTDLQTGLLNAFHLYSVLNSLPPGQWIGLSLVELYPQTRTAIEEIRHLRKAARALQSVIGENTPLFHIGQSVFAYPAWHCSEADLTRSGPRIIALCKRERFKSVHIGYSCGLSGSGNSGDRVDRTGQDLLDEAWQALQIAGRRGPFSFCSYRLLQNSQCHPLYASKRPLLIRAKPCGQAGQTRALQRCMRQLEQFALIQLHPSTTTESIFDLIHPETFDLTGGKAFQGPQADAYILLPTANQKAILVLAHQVTRALASESKDFGPVAAGIALFPYAHFKKNEIILNCQKALLHGALEGEGAITVFNALSLNVSGDIYYGEGDIPRAITEYRHGLEISPDDINLLNSLGVSYAMINRQTLAKNCFLQALAIDSKNFMAWYNLGLGRELQNDLPGALLAFEHAWACPLENDQDTALVRRELPLQLARLYCQTEHHQKSLDLLLPWHAVKPKESEADLANRSFCLLGESLFGLGRIEEARIALQRAILINEFDADALSLLGDIYLLRNEGDQIALKLCAKSLEINPAPPIFHFRLAKALINGGFWEEARAALRPCLRDQKLKGMAQARMGLLYHRWGKNAAASRWLNKALAQSEFRNDENGLPWQQQARSLLLEILQSNTTQKNNDRGKNEHL